jgi:hypothetical protein
MITTLRQAEITGSALILFAVLCGLSSPIVWAEPPIGESMSPSNSSFPLATGNSASLSDIRGVTCQSYSPISFENAFCGFEPTGAYGGEFPAVRLEAEPVLPGAGLIDNPHDFSYIQLDGNWTSKEQARWRLPPLELKL